MNRRKLSTLLSAFIAAAFRRGPAMSRVRTSRSKTALWKIAVVNCQG
jgi:hypothetical protein